MHHASTGRERAKQSVGPIDFTTLRHTNRVRGEITNARLYGMNEFSIGVGVTFTVMLRDFRAEGPNLVFGTL